MMRSLSSSATIFVLLFASQAFGWPAVFFAQDPKVGSITGHVKLDGKPAKGVTVIATASMSDPAKLVEKMFRSSASLKATTDSEGIYKFEGVPAGKYHVAPSAPVFVIDEHNSSSEVSVTEGEAAEDVDFALSLGGVITGKITDSGGRPVIGQRVSLKPEDPGTGVADSAGDFGERMYATDDRGVYRIFGLRPGRYTVSAGKDSLMSLFFSQGPKRVQTFYPGVTEEAKARLVQVTAGSEANGVDIQLGDADKGFVVSGRVVDSEKNAPVANAMVAYSKARKPPQGQNPVLNDNEINDDSFGIPGAFTTTNEKGEFRFSSVSPGSYRLDATSTTEFTGAGTGQFYVDPIAFEVRSANVDKLEVKVHRGAGISGVVAIESTDERDSIDRVGRLMLMAMVIDGATKSPSSSTCVVATDGSFRLGGLKPGKVTIRSFSMNRRLGILRIERNVVDLQGGFEIQANEEVTGIRVILVPATGVINGHVTIQSGALQPGAMLTARTRSLDADPSSDFDISGDKRDDVSPDGTFSIEGLTPGSYEVEVFGLIPGKQGASRVSAKQIVIVTNERPTEVNLVLDVSKGSDK